MELKMIVTVRDLYVILNAIYLGTSEKWWAESNYSATMSCLLLRSLDSTDYFDASAFLATDLYIYIV